MPKKEPYTPLLDRWIDEMEEDGYTDSEFRQLITAISRYGRNKEITNFDDRGMRATFRAWMQVIDDVRGSHEIGEAKKKIGGITRNHPEYKEMLEADPLLALATPAERAEAYNQWRQEEHDAPETDREEDNAQDPPSLPNQSNDHNTDVARWFSEQNRKNPDGRMKLPVFLKWCAARGLKNENQTGTQVNILSWQRGGYRDS